MTQAATEAALHVLEERMVRLEQLQARSILRLCEAMRKIADDTALCMARSETTRATDLEASEKATIENALAAAAGNKTRAAKLLGCTVKTLYNKMARYGIDGGGA